MKLQYLAAKLPKRPKDANKGTFGKVLVIAGSDNYPGAAYLSCAASYRVGVGLVSLATLASVKTIVSRKLPEVTFLSFDEIFEKINEYNAILLGCGLGQDSLSTKLVKDLLEQKLPPTVVDGDGLNILSKMGKWWKILNGKTVLTPHPGEMARLTGKSVKQIQSNREDIAKEYAVKWEQTVVLKGAYTVIASPTGEMMISPFINPALATAGTGDVLSGVIVGLIGQGLNFFDASCVGVYIHGIAGELMKDKFGDTGTIASDLLPNIPAALQKLKVNN